MNELASAADVASRLTTVERLAEAHEKLRGQAMALNGRYGWTTADHFSTLHPSLSELVSIESLDRAIGATRQTEGSALGVSVHRLADALQQLSAWVTGTRMAYGALDDINR